MGLRKEWRNISHMTKTQQIFDSYSFGDLYNVLKAHKSKINEIDGEGKMSLGGPLALMSKMPTKDSEIEVAEQVGSEDEGFLMNSEDEAMAYYSKYKVKKFFKKPFNPKYKETMNSRERPHLGKE